MRLFLPPFQGTISLAIYREYEMKKSDFSPMFPEAWGVSADAQYIQFPIPASTNDTGRASLALGFPPATMTPPEAGGSYPFGADVNGGFRMCSTAARNYESGIVPAYSATYSNDIGGYPLGAVVADASTNGAFWVSTTDDNLTTPGASGASWVSLFAPVQQGRLLGEVYLTSSTIYTPPPGTRYVEIELVGGGAGSGGVPAPANTSQVNVSTGGSAGSYVRARIYNAALFTNVQVTIGAPGPGGAVGTHDGVPGGTTSFGTYTAPGGSGGKTASVTSFPNAGLSVGTGQGSPSTSADISYVGAGPTLWQVINGTVGVTSIGGASPFGPGGYTSIGVDGGAQGAAGGLGAGGGGVMAPSTYTQGLAGAPGGQGLAIVRAYS